MLSGMDHSISLAPLLQQAQDKPGGKQTACWEKAGGLRRTDFPSDKLQSSRDNKRGWLA